ncbi:STAS domain-containing protein [Aquibacillus sediminis]|uniref:STAS domain-containing protein n=1 Tax=Aquibacillus sediminis TaxID=2574734 RepID=UPI0011096678|nr:STAS domain-containing protein [Aquibacillus sediminis]
MKEELGYIGQRVISNKEMLAQKTIDLQGEVYAKDIKEAGLSEKQILENRTELIHYLGEALFTDQSIILDKVRDWTNRAGKLAVQRGIPVENLIKLLSSFRTVIWESFSEELTQRKFAAITMLDVSIMINPIIDEIMFIISQMYAENNERKIKRAYNTMQQLSVPVVPIAKDIAVLPLIGEIDTHRAQLIMETALEQSTEYGLEYLIMDVSGVPIVDTAVAHSLFQVVNALQLIGVETTITGIRPEIAQTVVSLGIEFKGVDTLASLHQALEKIGFSRQ